MHRDDVDHADDDAHDGEDDAPDGEDDAGWHDARRNDAEKPMDAAGTSDAAKAYMEAMKRMDGPMMHGIQAGDPDVAVVQAMIPHHQGAIDMARAVVQFGKSHRPVAFGLPDRRHPSGQVFPACRAELCQKVQAAPVDFVL